MTPATFAALTATLPEAQVGFPGVRAWIMASDGRQVGFLDIEPIGVVPEHSHEEQWGFLVEGELELTIAGEARRVRAGQSYHIPANAPHSAAFHSRCLVIDVFASPRRYRQRVAPSSLDEVRAAIDRIDRDLVRLIADRGRWVAAAAGFKRTDAEARAPARVEEVVANAGRHAAAFGAPPEVVEATYRAMIAAFVELERASVGRR